MKKRYVIIPLAAVAGAALVALVAIYFYYSQGLSYDGEDAVAVKAPVEITRDLQGIPRIKAKSREDAYYALGYLHAQDRYSLMRYYRAVAYGRISRMVGERGAILDRFSRVVGFSRKAKEIRGSLGQPYLGYLKRYADGINAARASAVGGRILKRKWNETDIIAILVMKEWSNAFLNNRELVFSIPETARSKELEEIFPGGTVTGYDAKEADSVRIIDQLHGLVRGLIGSYNRGMAIYVPGKDAQGDDYLTGYTLDSDLGLYPGWYPVAMSVGDTEIRGISHVGMPFVFSGTNGVITFCGFSLNIDTQDFVIEQVRKLKDIVQYLGIGGWRNFQAIGMPEGAQENREEIPVIWATENGPVLNDIFTDRAYNSEVVTLKSIFPGADYLRSLFSVPYATNIDEAASLVRNVDSLPMIYLFASRDYAVTAFSGRVPLRDPGDRVFRDGTKFQWNGTADISGIAGRTLFETVIGSYDLTGAPAQVQGLGVGDRSRVERVLSIVEKNPRLTLNNIEDILQDNRSAYAEKFVPLFIEILKNNPVTSSRLARVYFHEWKFDMDQDKVAPALFETIMVNYLRETISDELGDRAGAVMENYRLLIPGFYEMVKRGDSKVFDDARTYELDEGSETIFDRAFFKALRTLGRRAGPLMEDWKWGVMHRGNYIMPFTKSSIIERTMYRIVDKPFGGGNSTVLYGATGADLSPVKVTSLTAIYNSGISRIHMNFATSTNPLSMFYYGRRPGPFSFDLKFLGREHYFLLRPSGE
ncbi:MAG: penicillin acylase family protein [Spirochaetes bacterium]|nr:penicillin acylase family protein [Spirochaetota bacterium]